MIIRNKIQILSFRICLLLFISAPVGCAEIFSEDIDPIDILESALSDSQPIIQIPMLSSDQWQGINSNIAVNLSAATGKSLDLAMAKSSADSKLWEKEINASSKDSDSSRSKGELRQMIQQINAVEFKIEKQTFEPLIAVETAKKTEPDETLPDTNVEQKTEPQEPQTEAQPHLAGETQVEEKLQHTQITKQTLERFQQFSQQPQQIKNPVELAEILFHSGQLKEAAKCYRQALEYMDANEISYEDKAWVIFQIGNCLQKDDPQTAMQTYEKLILTYPNSPWAKLAEAKSKIIDWYLKEKPDTLLNYGKE